jgi:hypothetical protein
MTTLPCGKAFLFRYAWGLNASRTISSVSTPTTDRPARIQGISGRFQGCRNGGQSAI